MIIAGTGLALFSLIVGGGFSAILLMGYIGTGGREAGAPLAFMLLVSALGFGLGFALNAIGRRMSRREERS
ncbi:MAG: hypothetical protein V2J89_03540 [Halieaceae bacterium]|jgi:hypothetical protein|nr:hypothetical protein [Halieaceae bacterium]